MEPGKGFYSLSAILNERAVRQFTSDYSAARRLSYRPAASTKNTSRVFAESMFRGTSYIQPSK